ncbi:hypothetical protein HMPREF0291_11018 [Corynebacterium genitalium ATCC 33030]|uniref:Uncharacterized protein n=1 Tax=Corynebacterium genitalium ATCC 33030 TaxID=585529 RepID=D7WC09_9CORY|nr:hypothetical protein HMPREF0291_11018 [Corynebacterium genitalium ATCC 33030]
MQGPIAITTHNIDRRHTNSSRRAALAPTCHEADINRVPSRYRIVTIHSPTHADPSIHRVQHPSAFQL